MALTIKQLNGDASFLLALEPINSDAGITAVPFRILLDPWITGPSNVIHPKISSACRVQPACISSLQDLPEPDVVVISQNKSDHCNEATLRQLPPTGSKTIILAEPAAARSIRSWNYFDEDMVRTLEPWQDPRKAGKDNVERLLVAPTTLGGGVGEVTISLIAQKRGLKGINSTIGITYLPPPSRPSRFQRPAPTPPATPTSPLAMTTPQILMPNIKSPNPMLLPALPPLFGVLTPPDSPGLRSLHSMRSVSSLSPHTHDRAVSLIFAPHGTTYNCLEPFVTSHLVTQAALPLTALLHCFDAVSHPWWLGGNVSTGTPAGQEIASTLGVRAWISTHDGKKTRSGFVSKMRRREKFDTDQVRGRVEDVERCTTAAGQRRPSDSPRRQIRPMAVMALDVGAEVTLTSEGVWESEAEEIVHCHPLMLQRSFEGLGLRQRPAIDTGNNTHLMMAC